ncbi:MAG: hypothetical protein F6J93_30285 [Oscillatoria sp. SIO1A7]|nr:hypothetical protein [Oscillatoria sp. SIO1A7]
MLSPLRLISSAIDIKSKKHTLESMGTWGHGDREKRLWDWEDHRGTLKILPTPISPISPLVPESPLPRSPGTILP